MLPFILNLNKSIQNMEIFWYQKNTQKEPKI
jgi:hypothetical protein